MVFAELIDSASYERRTANDPREHQQIVSTTLISKEKRVYERLFPKMCVKDGRIALIRKGAGRQESEWVSLGIIVWRDGQRAAITPLGAVERILPIKLA